MDNWEELRKYRKWVPITDENKNLVEDSSLIGIMTTGFTLNEKNEPTGFATLTSTAYRIGKIDNIMYERGFWPSIRRVIYKFRCAID